MAINRLTGFSSGLNTDTLVKRLLQVDQKKVDNVKSRRQISKWKQELYRDLIKKINAFKSKYFDVLKGGSNIRSATMFSKFKTSVKVGHTDSKAISVTGTSKSKKLNLTISKISQLAKKDKYISGKLDFAKIVSNDVDVSALPDPVKFRLSIDGKVKDISFNKSEMTSQDINGLTAILKDKIAASFGEDYRNIVSNDGNKLVFEKSGTQIAIFEDTSSPTSITKLGLTSGMGTESYKQKTIGDLLNVSDADLANMTVGGQKLSDLGITASTKLEEFIDKFNKNSSGAKLSYDSLQDKFSIEAKDEGTANALNLSSLLKSKLKLDTGTHEAAQNAKLTIDGKEVIKSSNTFSLDGTQVTLNEVYTGTDPIKVDLKRDVEGIKKVLRDFVKDYNAIVGEITKKLNEKSYRSFKPLTDEQKKDMNKDEIKLWETKAKSGILRNDSILSNMLSEMRTAMYESVEGTGMTLYKMGITTSKNYKDNGKLELNERKLNKALKNNFDDVKKFFTNESDKKYLSKGHQTERYKENGLGNRLLDIINNVVRTTRDTSGSRGSLIEKAGVVGDTSKTSNLIARELHIQDKKINALLAYLKRQENRYYAKFARMEKALSRLQNQSNSLINMLGKK